MTAIKDINAYNASMMKPLMDKLFFADKVKADLFVDFGCADGTLLNVLSSLFPQFEYLGYDQSPEMIELGRKKLGDRPNVSLTANHLEVWNRVEEAKQGGRKVCLILSSVIHEVYSYGPEKVEGFWKQVWALSPDFIAIRDMCVSQTASRPSDEIVVARVRQIFGKSHVEALTAWETQWGSLEENWSLTNFLLHYRYVENADREWKENYLPISKEKLLRLVPPSYVPHYINHYTLPFLRDEVWKDFGVQLQERTHLQLILRKI
jgi:hypothetical protein